MLARFCALIVRRAGWVLLATLLVTLAAIAQIVDLRTGQARLYLDPSIDRLLPNEDPDRDFYEEVRLRFGNDETLLVAVSDPDGIFQIPRLQSVVRMTERIEQLKGVHHVVSLATALNIRSADGDMQIEPFLATLPEDEQGLAQLRREALANPVYAGNLVSSDARTTALVVYLLDMPEREFLEMGLDETVREAALAEADGAEVFITGGARVKAATGRALLSDLVRIVPLTFVIMGVIALISFRSASGVVVPLGTILIALIWTLGVVAPTLGSLNIVTVVVPPIILVVGFAYAVHVVSAHMGLLQAGERDPKRLALEALEEVALPVLLTGLTTGAGFLSLSTSRLAAIAQFGVASTIGVVATMIVTLTFAPALLALWPPRGEVRPAGGAALDRMFGRLAAFDARNRVGVFAAFGAAVLLSFYGVTQIRVSTDFAANFSPESEVRSSFDAVNSRLEGSNPLYVVLDAGYRNAFLEPEKLAALQGLQEWLESQPEIGGTTSLVDYLMLINRGFHDDDPAYLAIPESRSLVSQLLLFGGNDELENFVDSRYQTVNVLVRSRAVDSGATAMLADRIEQRLAELEEPLTGRITGNTVLVARTIDDIALGQAISLSTAFVIIYVILTLLFTSFRVGLLALLPNALPVVIYFGALGLTGVTLNVTTGLVACLVLGIAVDDTIHYLARFNTVAKRTADEAHGVAEALRTVGRPVTYTSIALCVGFLVLTSASLRNLVEFGALASFTLFAAWLVDVTFTPALAARMRIVSLWDVLTLDLGEDPQHSISIFRGLSKTQARLAALATSICSFPKGHRLIAVGDEGREMYVVIDGTLEASVERDEGPVRLREHGRGDVIGEVGLFQGRRTANVDALSDVRLVRLTPENLERLRRRHPRIGAQLFRNISAVLADRLTSVTARMS